jgi:hypothetical protein
MLFSGLRRQARRYADGSSLQGVSEYGQTAQYRAFRWANPMGYVKVNPVAFIPDKPPPGKRENIITAEEYKSILALVHDDQETAQALLLDRIVYAESSGIRMLKFAKTLRLHAFGILAWYDYPISTGPQEGTNNKIKTMKRQAYGFRDPEFLRLKILGIHETTYALIG